MKLMSYLSESPRRIFLVIFLLCILITACGSSRKTGTVTGVALEEGQVVAVVKLDDGTEVKAIPMQQSGAAKVTGGEKVEVEPAKDSKLWKVVRVLETAK